MKWSWDRNRPSGQGQEKRENKIGIFLPERLFLDQASCVSKKDQQFQCTWEM